MNSTELYAVLIRQYQFAILAEMFTEFTRRDMLDAAKMVLAKMDTLNADGAKNERPRQAMEV